MKNIDEQLNGLLKAVENSNEIISYFKEHPEELNDEYLTMISEIESELENEVLPLMEKLKGMKNG